MTTSQTKTWIWASVATVFGILFLDQFSKAMVVGSSIHYVLNTGVIGGSFGATDNHVLKVLFILNFSLLLTLLFTFLMLFFQGGKLPFKISLAGLYASFFSNSLDRIFREGVVDFIPVPLGPRTAMMNLADVMQYVFGAVLAWQLIKHSRELWPDKNARGSLLVDRQSQLNMAAFFSMLSFIVAVGFSVLSYVYFKNTYSLSGIEVKGYCWMTALGAFFFSGVVFVFSLFYSLKFVGPIIAIRKYFDRMAEGHAPKHFVLRKTDYFKFLEESINKALGRHR